MALSKRTVEEFPSALLALGEQDRVKLKKAVDTEGRALAPGLTGTVVFCHGTEAYEIEFDEMHDVIGIPAEFLEKI